MTIAVSAHSKTPDFTVLPCGVLNSQVFAVELQPPFSAVMMPKQLNRAGNYAVSAGAMLEVANVGRPRGWTVVGAIHSHPGTFVEHSRFDDEMTPSRRAVSIVFPGYGDWRGPWPRNLGVHSYSGDYWHLLTDAEAAKRVKVDDEAQALWVDLR